MAEGFKPTQAMRSNAKRGLALREEHGRGGTATGVARARDISNGKSLPIETVRRMKAFFDRHQGNKDTPPEEGNGKIAWLLWGGDSGRSWANNIVERENDKMSKEADDELGEVQKNLYTEVAKVDTSLGLVFGYAIVSKENGKEYFDVQGDHIPEDAMLKAATNFMLSARVAKEMHTGDGKGTVVFAFPMTSDIATALDIKVKKTGLIIAMKPDSKEMLEKFAKGEFTGFSIGGKRKRDVVLEE